MESLQEIFEIVSKRIIEINKMIFTDRIRTIF